MTPEQKKTLDKARELLPKVTPGPWMPKEVNLTGLPQAYIKAIDGFPVAKATGVICEDETSFNAALIALAPDLAALADTLARRVEVLEGENARLREAVVSEASRRLHELVEWLQADEDHPILLLSSMTPIEVEAARAALSATQPKEPRT